MVDLEYMLDVEKYYLQNGLTIIKTYPDRNLQKEATEKLSQEFKNMLSKHATEGDRIAEVNAKNDSIEIFNIGKNNNIEKDYLITEELSHYEKINLLMENPPKFIFLHTDCDRTDWYYELIDLAKSSSVFWFNYSVFNHFVNPLKWSARQADMSLKKFEKELKKLTTFKIDIVYSGKDVFSYKCSAADRREFILDIKNENL